MGALPSFEVELHENFLHSHPLTTVVEPFLVVQRLAAVSSSVAVTSSVAVIFSVAATSEAVSLLWSTVARLLEP